MRNIAVFSVLLLAAGCLRAQIVLSRRVYAEHGRTFRQLWIANGGRSDFKQITYSARDHMEPLCSRDGKLIYFVSDRDGDRSLNAYAGANDRELWAFDRQTGQERRVWQTSNDNGLHLNGTTADGGVLVRFGTELRSLPRHPWHIDNLDGLYNSAAVSPDGRALAVVIAGSLDKKGQSHDAQLFIVNTATGQKRLPLGKYEAPAWSPGGTRIAAIADEGLAIIDVAAQKEVARVGWPNTRNAPVEVVWSPDEKFLLAGLLGENGGGGDPQLDYFLLNIATGAWTPALTAQKLLWLKGNGSVLYLRPVATAPLAPGSKHNVWTAQLAAFDLATHKDTILTAGVVLNDFLSSCGR